MLPHVSVVVPVLNAAAEVGRLLDSLLQLDYPADRLEILVVDNDSTDETVQVVSQFPVRLIREERIQGSYAARNRGLADATGDWVAFTDADCVAHPTWLKELLGAPLPEDIGAVAGEVVALELTTPVQRLIEHYGFMKHAVTLPHKTLPCFSTANVAVRRKVLTALRGFREDIRFFGDMELSWRMQLELRRKLLFRPSALIFHRHRRTLRELWWQGWQHGRGVAFMKRAYPDLYRIDGQEQMGRLRGILDAAVGALRGNSRGDNGPDRRHAPVFLVIWYVSMASGYVMGPARAEITNRRAAESLES